MFEVVIQTWLNLSASIIYLKPSFWHLKKNKFTIVKVKYLHFLHSFEWEKLAVIGYLISGRSILFKGTPSCRSVQTQAAGTYRRCTLCYKPNIRLASPWLCRRCWVIARRFPRPYWLPITGSVWTGKRREGGGCCGQTHQDLNSTRREESRSRGSSVVPPLSACMG